MRHATRNTRRLLLVLFVLPAVALSAQSATDPGLARAMQLEKTGDLRQASDAYRAWLDAHPKPADTAAADLYVEALTRLARVEPEARLVQHFLEAAPQASLSPGGRLKVLVALADLLDGLGEVERALEAYTRAAEAQTADASAAAGYLLRAASLLYEEGRTQEAETSVLAVLEGARGRADAGVASRALYVLGRIQAATARTDEALRTWGTVVEAYADSAWAPAAVFGIYSLSRSLERAPDAAAALARLETAYPDSPERHLAEAAGALALSPRPSMLLEPYLAAALPVAPAAAAPVPAAIVTTPAATPAAAVDDASLVVVLAGSYTSLENAEHHRRQIESRGFASRLAQVQVKGVSYYRVLVGDASTREAAITLSQKLKDKDLESTLLVVQAQTGG